MVFIDRNRGENVIQLERIAAKITDGRIDKINRLEDSLFKNTKPIWINRIYHYPSAFSFLMTVIVCIILVGGFLIIDKSEWIRNIPIMNKIFK